MANQIDAAPENNSLEGLIQSLSESTREVVSQLESWNGRAVLWIAKSVGQIPEWAAKHIKLTRRVQEEVLARSTFSNDEMSAAQATVLREGKKALKALEPQLDLDHYIACMAPENVLPKSKGMLRAVPGDGHRAPRLRKRNEQWYRNLGLIMNVYRGTERPEIKKLTAFLACNYLAKAAPICPEDLSLDQNSVRTLSNLFQLSIVSPGTSYNRECAQFDHYFRSQIQENFVAGSGQLFFLTDTIELEEVLPLWYHYVNTPTKANAETRVAGWSKDISAKLKQHLDEHGGKALDTFFSPPLLIDLTTIFEKLIQKDGASSETDFELELERTEKLLLEAIDKAVLQHSKSKEEQEKLRALIITNLTCLCRTQLNGIGILKILPALCHPKHLVCNEGDSKLLGRKESSPARLSRYLCDVKMTKSKVDVDNFLNVSGVRLGSVRGRSRMFDSISLEDFLAAEGGGAVEYVTPGPNVRYFERPMDLCGSAVFTRLEDLLNSDDIDAKELRREHPYLATIGTPTLKILKGLLSEVTLQRWNEVNADPELRSLVQTALTRIQFHLSEADLCKADFAKFSQWMELIQYEMATLITIFKPYKEEDFAGIFADRLTGVIPASLASCTSAGIGKSAMNVFAGMSAALRRSHAEPVRVFHPGSHFELVEFVGKSHDLQSTLAKKDTERVDLYLGEFNHNVRLYANHDEYVPGDVIAEVTKLLEKAAKTEHLTVAVDSTIDFVSSPQARAVLEHFSAEITGGKLNFIFFRSGQKFDMFGMDHFYGSPWYMINNGAPHWKPFKILESSDAFKTDPLSMQWFCLANKYAPKELDDYRRKIFSNTKAILAEVPQILKPGKNPKVKVCTVADGMQPCFIDIKCYGEESEKRMLKLQELIYKRFIDQNKKIHSRGGYGYFNPNVNLFPSGLDRESGIAYTTMRLHPGVDSQENELMIEFFNEVAELVREDELD